MWKIAVHYIHAPSIEALVGSEQPARGHPPGWVDWWEVAPQLIASGTLSPRLAVLLLKKPAG